VNDETLTTNNAASNISALISSGCTAGAVVNLGDITTGSVSSTSANTVNGSVSVSPALTASFGDGDFYESAFLSARSLSSDSIYQTASCPESGDSSSSDSASSSCALSCRLSQNSGTSNFMTFPALFSVSVVLIALSRLRKKSCF
jgi:hypothetical protein